jgi:colanic acid/amylovoran biosynthesis protein
MLTKPIAMVIGSPGPFASFWRQWIAKKILPRLNIVTNREPLSTAMLAYIGIKGKSIKTTACPSVLFKASKFQEEDCVEDYKKIINSERPLAGFILCGWNMPVGPYYRWPREDWEFEQFIQAIDYFLENTEYRVCVMTHQNGTDEDGNLIKGIDHRLVDRFIELLGDRVDGDRVYQLQGLYDAGKSKGLISNFDVLVSGRIHGAVQSLSQSIPSVIVNYGHEPRPHKLAGFARTYGVDDYLVSPDIDGDIVSGIARVLQNRMRIQSDLRERVPVVTKKALENFEVLKSLV